MVGIMAGIRHIIGDIHMVGTQVGIGVGTLHTIGAIHITTTTIITILITTLIDLHTIVRHIRLVHLILARVVWVTQDTIITVRVWS